MIEESEYRSFWGYKRKNYTAYHEAESRGLIPKMCERYGWSVNPPRQPSGYWTKEKVREVALKCKNRSEFSKVQSSAYNVALRNGWLDEFFPLKADRNEV
jgi:hypothetical protein